MQQHIRDALEATHRELADLPWRDPEFYKEFLAQTYHFVSHSTRLLAFSAARMGLGDETLFNRFLKHAAEEKSHHLLAEKDLAALGAQTSDYPELAATSALYRNQYFLAEFRSPHSLMGYIAFLEGIAVISGPGIYRDVKAAFGARPTLFVKVHAEEDPGHFDELVENLAKIPPALHETILRSFDETRFHYASLLATCAQNAATRRRTTPFKKAA